jgi:hypothetical protein
MINCFITKGRQIRSRVKWIEEGEKNTAYFLGLEKTRQTKKAINELYDKNGKSSFFKLFQNFL